jgi:hypothetical protein
MMNYEYNVYDVGIKFVPDDSLYLSEPLEDIIFLRLKRASAYEN